MSIGESGRIVLEIAPELKRMLYSTLALENKTLKEWFIAMAQEHIENQRQPRLFGSARETENR